MLDNIFHHLMIKRFLNETSLDLRLLAVSKGKREKFRELQWNKLK